MLKSNWSEGSARSFGKAYVIRQRIGLAAPRKSQAGHKFMDATSRQKLAAKLEREAARY